MFRRALGVLLGVCIAGCAHRATPSTTLTPEQIQHNLADAGALRSEHALLKQLAGNWKVESKFWMDPATAPEISKGTASARTIYGGRYLVQDYKGNFMHQPFNGQAILGFDNVNGKYFSTWIDSMSTMMMRSEGSANQNGEIILSSNAICPMNREPMETEERITLLDKDHYRWESYRVVDNQKIKGMEINYSRSK